MPAVDQAVRDFYCFDVGRACFFPEMTAPKVALRLLVFCKKDPAKMPGLSLVPMFAVPVHTADAGLLEGGGEAAGAAAVEAYHIDAAGGCHLRGIDAHRLPVRNRLGHRAGKVEQQSLIVAPRLLRDATIARDVERCTEAWGRA